MAKSAVVRKTIKNMLGGVSQQPPLQRLESQCEEMVNCVPSLTEFLKRRNGVHFINSLAGNENAKENIFIDFIERGDNEAGLVTVDETGLVTVYSLNGEKIGQTQNSYLASTNPKDDIKLCTVRDYNFLVNTKNKVAENAGTEAELDKELLVVINQVSYGETYHLRLKMKNKYGSCYIDTSYSVPEAPAEDITASMILSNLRVMAEGQYYAKFFCSGTPNYSAALLVQQPPHSTKVLLGAGEGCTPDNTTLIGTKCSHTNCNGVLLGVNAKINIVDIYENVAVANITGLSSVIDIHNIYALTNLDIDILAKYKAEISDSSGGALTTTINHKCKSFSDLPVYAPDGYYVEVEGDNGQKNDNYYLKFKLSNDNEYSRLTMEDAEQQSGMGRGGWVETVKWGDDVTLNKDTMPVVLKINTDNITVETIDWKGRLAGDKKTNPSPSFVGKTIKDIFFYNNRLGFITDDNIILSEAGEYFNFYQTTALALLDSDPIDVAVSGTKVSALKYVVPYAEGLFIYSDRSLYVLEYGEVLSTANVELKPVLQFDTSLSTKPCVCDTSIYYVGKKGSYNQVREYKPTDQSDQYGYSNDITSHIPKYITGNVRKMCISLEDGIMFLVNETSEVFCYSFIKDNGELLLSSWHKWEFQHPVLMGTLFKGWLYLVFRESSGRLYLGKLAVSDADNNYSDSDGLNEIFYFSSYKYSLYYLRDSSSKVLDIPTMIRTMSLKYTKGSEFKVIIDRKNRKQEERSVDKKRDFTRFLAASENKDFSVKIESVEDKPFNIIETDLEVVYASRS